MLFQVLVIPEVAKKNKGSTRNFKLREIDIFNTSINNTFRDHIFL